jgi:predicted nucleic-acid-binding protein
VWIAKSVLLELNWVLRKTYGFGADAAANGVEAICGLSVAVLEEEEAVFLALKWSRQGLEFADALHLASRGRSETFATFDRSLLRAARKLGLPVEEP